MEYRFAINGKMDNLSKEVVNATSDSRALSEFRKLGYMFGDVVKLEKTESDRQLEAWRKIQKWNRHYKTTGSLNASVGESRLGEAISMQNGDDGSRASLREELMPTPEEIELAREWHKFTGDRSKFVVKGF